MSFSAADDHPRDVPEMRGQGGGAISTGCVVALAVTALNAMGFAASRATIPLTGGLLTPAAISRSNHHRKVRQLAHVGTRLPMNEEQRRRIVLAVSISNVITGIGFLVLS